jgi:predicted ATPase/DNA-binding SARP family transcriptional activator
MPRIPLASKKEFALYLFGEFQLETREGAASCAIRLPRRKVELLFAYLVLFPEPNGHSREKLATLFWGDTTDEQARASLRTSLAVLRKTLGEDALIADRERVQLNPRILLWVDVWEFLQLRTVSPETAVDLYRSDLLPDAQDDWARTEREHLHALCIDTLLRLTQQMRSQSEYERAIEFARRVIAIDAANETAYQHLMFCEMARGNRANALMLYDEMARALREELAVEPARETQALLNWIKQTPSLLPSDAARITNLPIPLSSFIGRKNEMIHIKTRLGGSRLLTLVGAGGSGKTRLSIQVSIELIDSFRDGVWWIELANLNAEPLVAKAAAKTLGVDEVAHQSMLETLANYLRPKHLLLILDNCEHLITACAELAQSLLRECPDLKILTTSREPLNVAGENVWQVSTLSVPTHALTREQLLMSFEGVRLFVERAQAINPQFVLTEDNAPCVIEICRRLDGIPLALELAAARVAVLSVQQIAARLDDRFSLLTTGSRTVLARQQTLRALIDWSHDLLSETERVLFRRLSVFVDGWSLPAANAVVGDLKNSNILDIITQLVNKSLLLAEPAQDGDLRYRFLDTIRQYAHDKLVESGEEERLRQRHCAWAISFAEIADGESRGADQLLWLARLEQEYNNLRAPLEYARRQSDQDHSDLRLRLAAALARFWQLRGYWSEGRIWLAPALDSDACTVAQARALIGLAELVSIQEGFAISQPLYEESLTQCRALGDKWGIALSSSYSLAFEDDPVQAKARLAECLALAQDLNDEWLAAMAFHRMGIFSLRQGEQDNALLEQGLVYARKTGDRWLLSSALVNLGELVRLQMNYERVAVLYDEALVIERQLGDKHGLAVTLHNQGHMAMRQGDVARATVLFKESFAIFREHGRKQGMVECVSAMGGVAAALEQPARAAQLLGATDSLFAGLQATMDPTDRVEYEHNIAVARAQMDESAFAAAWAEGHAMTLEQAIALVEQSAN